MYQSTAAEQRAIFDPAMNDDQHGHACGDAAGKSSDALPPRAIADGNGTAIMCYFTAMRISILLVSTLVEERAVSQ